MTRSPVEVRELLGSRDLQSNLSGVRSRSHDKVVLQLPLFPVINQVHARKNSGVDHPTEVGYVGAPLRRVVPDEVIGYRHQPLLGSGGHGPAARHRHAQHRVGLPRLVPGGLHALVREPWRSRLSLRGPERQSGPKVGEEERGPSASCHEAHLFVELPRVLLEAHGQLAITSRRGRGRERGQSPLGREGVSPGRAVPGEERQQDDDRKPQRARESAYSSNLGHGGTSSSQRTAMTGMGAAPTRSLGSCVSGRDVPLW